MTWVDVISYMFTVDLKTKGALFRAIVEGFLDSPDSLHFTVLTSTLNLPLRSWKS